MADNKGEIDSLQVDAEEVVSGDTESVQSAEVSTPNETESVSSAVQGGGGEECSSMVTFLASEIYPGEEQVSFTLKEARSLFPILDDFCTFPIIHEENIVLKTPFPTRILRILNLIHIFLTKIKIGPICDTWCGDVYNFNAYDLNGLKEILISVPDIDLISTFKCAMFYQNSSVERVLSRLFIHKILAFDNRLIDLRQFFGFSPPIYLSEEYDFLELYTKCVKHYQSYVFHQSQRQFYNQNSNGDILNGQSGKWLKTKRSKRSKRIFKGKIVFCGQHNCEKSHVNEITTFCINFPDRLLSNALKRPHGDDSE